ncbi:MAG: hypothetical protein N2444_11120 [Methylocystis sp.]|nr:hypothetical protein [Methylocystis sp.]
MSPTRIITILATSIVVIVGLNVGAFTYPLWGPSFRQYWDEYWKARTLKPATKAGDRTISECLGVSDFYSAHLTTYFLADSAESAGGATDDLSKYDEYCDRVPGTGKVIFAITLMEKEARAESVALSFHEVDASGGQKLINSLPPKPSKSGMMTLDATIAHKGKYVLRLAFGEGKNKEDIIEMPITVVQ